MHLHAADTEALRENDTPLPCIAKASRRFNDNKFLFNKNKTIQIQCIPIKRKKGNKHNKQWRREWEKNYLPSIAWDSRRAHSWCEQYRRDCQDHFRVLPWILLQVEGNPPLCLCEDQTLMAPRVRYSNKDHEMNLQLNPSPVKERELNTLTNHTMLRAAVSSVITMQTKLRDEHKYCQFRGLLVGQCGNCGAFPCCLFARKKQCWSSIK